MAHRPTPCRDLLIIEAVLDCIDIVDKYTRKIFSDQLVVAAECRGAVEGGLFQCIFDGKGLDDELMEAIHDCDLGADNRLLFRRYR